MTNIIKPRRAVVLTGLVAALHLVGCEQQEFRMPPYIVEKDCEFTLVIGSDQRASASVPKGNTKVKKTLSVGRYKVEVANCEIVKNRNGLPVYSD